MLTRKNLIRKSDSPSIADNCAHIPPTRRSVMAILDNRMLESLCSSPFFLIAMIINAFKRTAAGEIIDAKVANIQGEMVPCTSHSNCGTRGQ